MKFATEKDVAGAVATGRKAAGNNRCHFPVLFKKAVMEYAADTGTSIAHLAGVIEVSDSTLYYWQAQYKRDLYTLEGAYNVSQKSKDINSAILTKIQKKIARLQAKLALVKQCSDEGIKVAGE